MTFLCGKKINREVQLLLFFVVNVEKSNFLSMRIKRYRARNNKLQSQLSNSNKKQNLRKVKICGSHRFEEDREATMCDGGEKK